MGGESRLFEITRLTLREAGRNNVSKVERHCLVERSYALATWRSRSLKNLAFSGRSGI